MRFIGPETVTDAFGPKAIRPAASAQLGDDPLRPVDLVGRGRERLAERAGNSSTEAESAGMAVYAHELSHNLASRTTTTTRSRRRRSGRPAACGT